MGIIYLIKNKIDGKCYVGQTIRTLEKRWSEHCKPNDECIALRNAIQKYSPKNFDVSVIMITTDDLLNELEQENIIKYNSLYPNGYNIQTGGSKGKKHCAESREKMRQSKLGNKNPNFGKPRNDETKKKISLSKQGEKHHFYGKHLKLDHKLNLSKAHKNDDLPMYMVHIKARPEVYQSEGYGIINHPKGKKKWFTSKKLTLNEKYDIALQYLNDLNSL